MTNAMPLHGQTALITGGGSGIGAAAARAFASAGANVCIIGRNMPPLQEVASTISDAKVLPLVADVSDYDSICAAINEAAEVYGGLDIVFANAGVLLERDNLENTAPDLWKKAIEINLIGVYNTVHAAIPHLKARGGGKIIVTGSGRGRRATTGLSAYACSKAATWMLVRCLAEELREYGIAVNEIIPGPVMTPMNSHWGDKIDPIFLTGPEYVKTPEEVMPLLMFVATQSNTKGPTGQSFSLNRREI